MIMLQHHETLTPAQANNAVAHEANTIPKNKILNWLYSTDRHVSLEKLGSWLENNTDGQYKLVRNNINKDCA